MTKVETPCVKLSFWALTLALSTGCSMSSKLKKLDEEEYDHYMALRVYLDRPDARGVRSKDERKAFFKNKTRAERDQWLKDKGLWDKFYQYDAHIRDKIVQGAVQVGWDKHMVYQAWGMPFVRRKLPGRQAQRSELFVYRFEVRKDGPSSVDKGQGHLQSAAVVHQRAHRR